MASCDTILAYITNIIAEDKTANLLTTGANINIVKISFLMMQLLFNHHIDNAQPKLK